MTHAADKTAARDRARTARRAIAPDAAARAAEALRDRLLAMPVLDGVSVVLAYGASAEELALGPAVAALRERGARIAYPRVVSASELDLHVVADESELVTGSFGILEPPSSAPTVAAEDVDVVLVPGLAFDAHGFRVGYGGGYYDRLLLKLENAVRLGIAYDEQLSATPLPHEEHDEPVDVVVTPTRTIAAE
jgi:5-formyltetrahydrofolate cyclo-ligase